MPSSNSCVFEVALSWTSKHAGVTNSPTLNSHCVTRTKPYLSGSAVPPIRRNLKLCGCCHGAAEFALPIIRTEGAHEG